MTGRKVACFITLPNALTYQFEILPNDPGSVCLNKICGALAIVEHDYFGLLYKHKNYRYWLNLRNDIDRQVKSPPPYRFELRVKYFIGPEHIQQESTRVLFYVHLRNAIANGEFHVPREKQPYIGALMAHIEDGPPPTNVPTMMYPCFFPNCEIGVSRRIAIEHQSLAGLSRSSAEALFLNELSHMDGYGCHRYPVKSHRNEEVILSIGGSNLSSFTLEGRMIHRIPYSSLLEAAYKDKYFTVRYRTFNDQENTTVSYTVKTPSHKLALSMFRMLTEDHTFFYHERVGDRVLNHHMALTWKELMKKTLMPGASVKSRYHFDIVRTKMEAYSHAWEILHQLQGTGPVVSASSSDSDQGPPQRTPPTLRAITIDGASTSDAASSFNFTQQEPEEFDGYLRIGLSRSSTVLAKEILENTGEIGGTTLQKKHSKSADEFDDASEVDKSLSTTSLNTKLGEKFRQFLRKIEDSHLCKVCYDKEVSVVFCPCGHHVCCQRCAGNCHICPICRKHIAHIQLVFTI